MHDQCLVAEYRSWGEARVGLEVLAASNFTAESVSVVSRKDDRALKELGELRRGAEGGEAEAGKEAGLGALLGAAIASPVAVSTMTWPLLVAGPLAGVVGGAVGGVLGGAKKWGVDEEASKTYQQRIEEGSVLILVSDRRPRLDEAERALKTTETASLERFASSDLEAS